MDTATKHDLQSLNENLSQLLAKSFTSLQDSIGTQLDKSVHGVNVIQEALGDHTPHPRGHPGSVKAPIFQGDGGDALSFIEQYQLYAKFFGWTDQQAFNAFPLSLTGNAQIWYSTIDKSQIANLSDLLDLFRDRFLNSSQHWILRQELLKRRQAPQESVSDFAADIRKRAQRLKIPEQEQLHYFVQGLRPELRNYVMLQQPETLEQAENAAKIKSSVGETPVNALNTDVLATLQRLITLQEKQCTPQPQVAVVNEAPRTNEGNQRENNWANQDMRRMIQQEIRAQQNRQRPFDNQFNSRPSFNRRGDFGRGLRTTTGQVICNKCGRVGHFARACSSYSQQPRNDPRIPRPPMDRNTYEVRSQTRFQDRSTPQRNFNQSN